MFKQLIAMHAHHIQWDDAWDKQAQAISKWTAMNLSSLIRLQMAYIIKSPEWPPSASHVHQSDLAPTPETMWFDIKCNQARMTNEFHIFEDL